MSGACFHSASFDFSVWEMWGALLHGGRLVVVPQEVTRNPESFDRLLREEGVTVLSQTPSAFGQLTSVQPRRALGDLRLVVFGGEALDFGTLAPWFELHDASGPRLVNMYGITETTVHVTHHLVRPEECVSPEEGGGARSHIGEPLADLRLALVDRHTQLVPPGVPGEILVAGAGLARGYLNRPRLTAERFVPEGFSDRPGARLYRSGDLARRPAGGVLEYLGRIDHQVKVRGFRIELGEVEAALRRHPEVSAALVLGRRDVEPVRIVAYVVPCEGTAAPDRTQLRTFLGQQLPEAYLPAEYVFLDALPLGPTGKVDRRVLPSPEEGRSELERTYEAPRTPAEETLAELFAEHLNVDQVGRTDDFFELGGHSLLTLRLIGRVRKAFGIDVTLESLYENPTPAGLATVIETSSDGGRGVAAPIERASREDPLPLSFAQQRLYFLDQMVPGNAFYNVPGAVRLVGQLDPDLLRRALSEVRRRHESMRTRFIAPFGQPVQVIDDAADLALPRLDLRALPAPLATAAADRVAAEEARRPFDLGRGPLIRATLLTLGEQDHLALITLHHVVSDAWSLGVLIREVAALYRAYSAGEPSPLPELEVQYGDYALWQRRRLNEATLEREVAWWRGRLAGAPPVLELPADRPRPAVESFRGGVRGAVLDAPWLGELLRLAASVQATPFMTFLAGFQILLRRLCTQDDFMVGTSVANRNRQEVEDLVGFFVNEVVLRSELADTPTFRELLERVRSSTREALAHSELPFERLVEALRPERDLSRNPLFQVALVYNEPLPPLELPGLVLEAYAPSSQTSKMDLSLLMWELDEDRLSLSMEYNSDLFDATTVARILRGFRNLLETAATDPERSVEQLDLFGASDHHQLLCEWNDTRTPFGGQRCLHELIEARPDTCGERVAVESDDIAISYLELDARAERLARLLVERGAGPESRIGLSLERSPEMVVGLLAILKASGAYVPLDPEYPRSRLDFMLEDSRASLLVTRRGMDLPSGLDPAGVVYVEEVPGRPTHFRPHRVSPVPGQPSLRDLHVGLDGTAQGRHEQPSRGRKPSASDAGRLRSRRDRPGCCRRHR